jgi:7-dehydrocholesterol reductase
VRQAGFYETWGCLVWVPCVYTLHTRILVRSPSDFSWPMALTIFGIGVAGVLLNFWADSQRMMFREKNGKCLIWGKEPKYIKAQYEALNSETGKVETHQSLLLASGWWGVARHFQYLFELTAAWSWGLLGVGANFKNGPLPLFYAIFLTILLVDRAKRDEKKCLKKYGEYYKEYMKMVKYKIIPFVY